ncbi:TadE/TadG family type IV pilus assembly protein [Streptomyces sp. NRRL F-5126]|uniref:TadE/TadG family type IV pilus assembly protein n=1 Tax=Streptomyces sp. NRRL F-5126 TaxID=1463857 RepID=UPI00068E312C|nr:TadE/TadG family type IV pilus assembly protein [Streptomyces sp. NRRL F-5126]
MRRRVAARIAALRGDRGQAAIEFTGMIPVILVTLALMWEAALVGYAFSVAGDAADEAAHAAAVGGDCQAAAHRALPGAFHASASCGPGGTMATADVKIGVPVLFPGFALPIDVTGHGAAVQEDQHAGS